MSSRIGLTESAIPLVVAAVILLGSVVVHPINFAWPLAAGAVVAAGIARRAGFAWRELGLGAAVGMKSTLIALSILLLVGALIGVWASAGTVPVMVYYGLNFANPRYLVPAAFLLALFTSCMLGTSIGTLSTLGVAIMGVARGVGTPLPLVAGALVSGALFGDRSSPLSGSLNLNAAMTGSELRRLVLALLPAGGVAVLLSLVGYIVLGAQVGAGGLADRGLQAAIAANVNVSPWLLLPPALVLVLALARVPVRWALGAGILAGAVLGVFVGGVSLWQPAHAALFGSSAQTGNPGLDRVLSGGGLLSMVNLTVLILTAGAFSGMMEATGMMPLLIGRVVAGVQGPIGLIRATMSISIVVAMVAANQALSIIVPGRMLRPAYERMGLTTVHLSVALADSGTVVCCLVPWNLMALLASAAVGVPVLTYAPYALFAWLLPLVSLGLSAVRANNCAESEVKIGQA